MINLYYIIDNLKSFFLRFTTVIGNIMQMFKNIVGLWKKISVGILSSLNYKIQGHSNFSHTVTLFELTTVFNLCVAYVLILVANLKLYILSLLVLVFCVKLTTNLSIS